MTTTMVLTMTMLISMTKENARLKPIGDDDDNGKQWETNRSKRGYQIAESAAKGLGGLLLDKGKVGGWW